jgi:hypothetical protein
LLHEVGAAQVLDQITAPAIILCRLSALSSMAHVKVEITRDGEDEFEPNDLCFAIVTASGDGHTIKFRSWY